MVLYFHWTKLLLEFHETDIRNQWNSWEVSNYMEEMETNLKILLLTVCFKTFIKIPLYPIIRTCYSTTKTKHLRSFRSSLLSSSLADTLSLRKNVSLFWSETLCVQRSMIGKPYPDNKIYWWSHSTNEIWKNPTDTSWLGICIPTRSSAPMWHRINYSKLSRENSVVRS